MKIIFCILLLSALLGVARGVCTCCARGQKDYTSIPKNALAMVLRIAAAFASVSAFLMFGSLAFLLGLYLSAPLLLQEVAEGVVSLKGGILYGLLALVLVVLAPCCVSVAHCLWRADRLRLQRRFFASYAFVASLFVALGFSAGLIRGFLVEN